MVDLGSLVLLMSIFGTKVAIFYVVVGLALAVAGGTLLERLHMEKHVEQFVFSAGSIDIESPELTRREPVSYTHLLLRVPMLFVPVKLPLGTVTL